MTDIVIKPLQETTSFHYEESAALRDSATRLGNYKDERGAISKGALFRFLYKEIPEEKLDALHDICEEGNIASLNQFLLGPLMNISQAAINLGIATEVTLPDVPNLCQNLALKRV